MLLLVGDAGVGPVVAVVGVVLQRGGGCFCWAGGRGRGRWMLQVCAH